MKPRIRKNKYKGWCCIGGGITCHGESFTDAFKEWDRMYGRIQRQYELERSR